MSTNRWIDSKIAAMSLQEKVGQLFFVATTAQHYANDDRELLRIEAAVRDWGVGGLHIWGGTPAEQIQLYNRMQSIAKTPLLFSADFENGMGPRFRGGTYFPPAMAIAATGDSSFAYELGRLTAQEGRALGIHLSYSPVVDINSNPMNPIINTRSFGETAEQVALYADAFIRGAHDGGLLTAAKHFPGHGDTEQDTHLTLPVVTADADRLNSLELIPFKSAIDAGVDAIMSAHIRLPNRSAYPYKPASLAPDILTNLLRDEMQFDGLVITDALEMQAIQKNFTNGFAAVSAVQAGVDILLVSPQPKVAMDAIVNAVQQGRVPESRIDASVRRILAAKAKAGLHQAHTLSGDTLAANFGLASSSALARKCARQTITLLKNNSDVLPLSPSDREKNIAVIAVQDDPVRYRTRAFAERLQRALPNATSGAIKPGMCADSLAAIHARAEAADIIILHLYATLTSGNSSVQLPENVIAEVQKIIALGKPMIAVSLGNPYLIQQMPDVDTYICAYDDDPLMQHVSADALLGRQAITGKIPITVPSLFQRGDGIELVPTHAIDNIKPVAKEPMLQYALPEEAGFAPDSVATIDRLMANAVADSAFPGASLLIAKDGKIVHHKSYGNMGYGEYQKPVPQNAMYDLASVTKVIATTTAVMMLVDQGKLDLHATVQSYLPDFQGAGKDSLTVLNFLVHNSGLPPFKRYFLESTQPGEIVSRILIEPLEYTPGTETRYSDLGIILTGKIIEKITGQPLDVFCQENIFSPLGMHDTMFNPPESYWYRIPPTEDDPWRGRMVHGVVHDENAFALGGVAGHAGLFSTSYDLAILLQMLLNGGEYDGVRLLSTEVIDQFTTRQNLTEGSTRAIGWDTRSEHNSSSGHFMSMRAFGHTGFTGNSVWVDPEKDLFVILLSNRVHPTRENRKIYRFRPVLHDAVMRGFGLANE